MADLRRNLEEKPTDIDVISELVTAILGYVNLCVIQNRVNIHMCVLIFAES